MLVAVVLIKFSSCQVVVHFIFSDKDEITIEIIIMIEVMWFNEYTVMKNIFPHNF